MLQATKVNDSKGEKVCKHSEKKKEARKELQSKRSFAASSDLDHAEKAAEEKTTGQPATLQIIHAMPWKTRADGRGVKERGTARGRNHSIPGFSKSAFDAVFGVTSLMGTGSRQGRGVAFGVVRMREKNFIS